jgi:23S rRNA A2030 N6-methylase RlmJ
MNQQFLGGGLQEVSPRFHPMFKMYDYVNRRAYKAKMVDIDPDLSKPLPIVQVPGGAQIAQYFMGPCDNAVLVEESPREFDLLMQLIGDDPRFKAYNAQVDEDLVRAVIPPRTQRGVVYVQASGARLQAPDFSRLIQNTFHRFPLGTFAIPYMIFKTDVSASPVTRNIVRTLRRVGFRRLVGIEAYLDTASPTYLERSNGMHSARGVGMIVTNPPRDFYHEMRSLLPVFMSWIDENAGYPDPMVWRIIDDQEDHTEFMSGRSGKLPWNGSTFVPINNDKRIDVAEERKLFQESVEAIKAEAEAFASMSVEQKLKWIDDKASPFAKPFTPPRIDILRAPDNLFDQEQLLAVKRIRARAAELQDLSPMPRFEAEQKRLRDRLAAESAGASSAAAPASGPAGTPSVPAPFTDEFGRPARFDHSARRAGTVPPQKQYQVKK